MAGNDSFTVSLLHCDGSDASTTFTDDAAGGSHTWTANGNAQIDTAQSKFGGASALFDGTGDYVTTGDSADWTLGSGDFAVDLWFNRNGGNGTDRTMIAQSNSAGSDYNFYLSLNASNVVEFGASIGGIDESILGTTAFTATGWHHVAFVRTGDTLKLFVDGVQEGGDNACSGSVRDSAGGLSIGRPGDVNASYWNGWLDEVRISKGIARWTGNFTPPTEAYSADAAAVTTIFGSGGFPEFRHRTRMIGY